jgi:hypothetical protein
MKQSVKHNQDFFRSDKLCLKKIDLLVFELSANEETDRQMKILKVAEMSFVSQRVTIQSEL